MMFSLIIPVYNVAPFLHECLNSILLQTFEDWECLCVDDGSTDGSSAILDEYAAKDSRFRIFHKENGGVSSARNLALDNANGDWIWCVDADDAIRPESLQHIHDVVSFADIDAYAFGGYIRGRGLHDSYDWPQFTSNPFLIHNHKNLFAYERFKIGAWIMVFRRNRFKLRYKPYSISEDVLFNVSVYWQSKSVATDDAVLYFYRQRYDSAIGSSLNAKGVGDALMAADEIVRLEGCHRELFVSNPRYVSFRRRTSLAGYMDRFLRLPNSEKTKIMNIWLALQQSALHVGFAYRYQKIAVVICTIFPYGVVADKCIRTILRLNNRSVIRAAIAFVAHRLGYRHRLMK